MYGHRSAPVAAADERRAGLDGRRLSYLEGGVSAGVNVALFCVKMWAGTVSGSVAMVADAWHTLSDTLTSAVVVIGAWASAKPGDRRHPFGHGRSELIAAVVIGCILGVVTVRFAVESVERLRTHAAVSFSMIPLLVFAGSAVLKEALAQFSIRAGRRLGAPSVVADGWHHRSDAISTAVIVVGAFAGAHAWWVDGVLGIAVSLCIGHAAWTVFRGAADALLGRGMEPGERAALTTLVRETAPGAGDPHHFHMHRYGHHKEASMHMTLPGEMTVREGHEVASRIESEARRRLGLELTIHMEPRGG